MKQSKISIIVVYDNVNNLEECVNSLLKQSFNDIEIICINNGAKDNAQDIMSGLAGKDERIKLINLPLSNDINIAKQTGLGVADGEFICFVNPESILPADFVKNLFVTSITKKKFDVKDNHLYRRAFLENNEEIAHIINDKIKAELNNSSDIINSQKNEIKDEFNKFYQTNLETIKNSAYEVTNRFNQLEKLFYEKDYQNNQKIQDSIKELYEKADENSKHIYEDISKVYEHIASEINKKGVEINNVYEEITKNYHYTEQLVADKANEYSKINDDGKDALWQRLKELEKEIVVRYVNLKRLFDLRIDELLSGKNLDAFKNNESDNIGKIYIRLDEMSGLFYEELSKIYRELNEKLIKKCEENQYNTELKISELRNEFDAKLQNLKEELSK